MTTQVNRAMAMLLAAACKPLMPELQIPNASTPETATDAAMLIVTYQGKTFNVFVEALLSGEDEQMATEIDQLAGVQLWVETMRTRGHAGEDGELMHEVKPGEVPVDIPRPDDGHSAT